MKLIPLTKGGGHIVAHAMVDDGDFDRFRHFRWHLSSGGYAARSVSSPSRTHLLHREIMGVPPGDPREVDHRDRIRLNDQRYNLRIVPVGANAQNKSSHGKSTSRFRGVSWHKSLGKWRAYGHLNGKQHHLGYFDDEVEAGRVTAEWRKQHFLYSET